MAISSVGGSNQNGNSNRVSAPAKREPESRPSKTDSEKEDAVKVSIRKSDDNTRLSRSEKTNDSDAPRESSEPKNENKVKQDESEEG